MEARDSVLSSFPMASNRDGGSADVDDEGVLFVKASLAKDAAALYQSCKFDECLEILYQLLQMKETDPKVLHNIAIAEYVRDDCSDPRKLLEVLNNIKKRSEDLARTSRENMEAVSNLGNKVVLGSKGNNTMDSTANNSTDEFDTSVDTLNIAAMWFHLHQYKKALSVLEPLYQNIESIDETIALHLCFLLLDVVLACEDASKIADVLNYMEKAFEFAQGDNGISTQQSTDVLVKSSSCLGSSLVVDSSNLESAACINASEIPLSRISSEEMLETMLSKLDMGGQNLARPAVLSSSNDLLRTPDSSNPGFELKLMLQLFKVRFLLLTRNLKLAKREVKHAINISRGRDSSEALILKSQLEYARGNHPKAIKLLLASSTRTEEEFLTIFSNNLGCIYYQLGKYHISSVLFSKALSNRSCIRKEKPLKRLALAQDKSILVTYNCGLQYLTCGKPIHAAHCLQKVSLVFCNRPLLWLRLAECCLMALNKGLLRGDGVSSGRSEVRVNVIGKGKWRHLGISKHRYDGYSETDDSCVGNDGQPKLSMSFARQCLFNALHLLNCSKSNYSNSLLEEESESSVSTFSENSNHINLPSIDSKASTVTADLGQVNANGDAKEQKGGASQENIQSSLSCYEDICRRENLVIMQALFSNLAYVELELGNPLKALSTAKSLLKLSDCSRICIFLGHVYAAEALCLLNRVKEAADHLLIYLSEPKNFDLPYCLEDKEQWQSGKITDCQAPSKVSATIKHRFPKDSAGIISFLKPEEARGALFANFATVYALQGDLEQAHQFVMQALSIIPNNLEATLTAVYIDLVLGNSLDAIAKLKQCSQVRFLPSNLTSNNHP